MFLKKSSELVATVVVSEVLISKIHNNSELYLQGRH